jgi:hypothetical protein
MIFLGQQMLDIEVMKSNVIFGPMKIKQLQPSAAATWGSQYNQSDVSAFLAAANQVVNHPNSMLDLR